MFKRFRHRRVDEEIRNRYRETRLCNSDFIWPLFLVDGNGILQEISSMTGVHRYSADTAVEALREPVGQGLKAVLLFGIPKQKGVEQAWSIDGIVQKAIPIIKEQYPALEVITDVCLCSFTQNGHCHIGDNDATCEILAKIAVSHALAGADTVAPSDMMDGRVSYIKRALIESNYGSTRIMSYAAKYASNFYGPFRDAAECTPQSGDRSTYQMDPANREEAMAEIAADIEEGADSIIVKPALAYLDVIATARSRFRSQIIAYNVSGEYAMLNVAVSKGWARKQIIDETILSIKRAGAHRIISYFTPWMLSTIQ